MGLLLRHGASIDCVSHATPAETTVSFCESSQYRLRTKRKEALAKFRRERVGSYRRTAADSECAQALYSSPSRPAQNAFFFSFFPCLSRACLGQLFVFSLKQRSKEGVFLTFCLRLLIVTTDCAGTSSVCRERLLFSFSYDCPEPESW